MKTIMLLISLIASAMCASNHLRLKNRKERLLALKKAWINATIKFWYDEPDNPTTAKILNVREGPKGGPNGLYKVILVDQKTDGHLLDKKKDYIYSEFGYGAYDSGKIWDMQQNGIFEPVGTFERKNDNKNDKERLLALKRAWNNVTIEYRKDNSINVFTAEITNVHEGPKGGPNRLYTVILVDIVMNDGNLSGKKAGKFFEFGYGAYDSGKLWEMQQNGKKVTFEPVGEFKRKNDDPILEQLINPNFGTQPSFKVHVPRFPVKFMNEDGSYATATVDIDNWLRDCSIGKVYKIMDLRKHAVRPFGIFKNRILHHQAVLVNSRVIPEHPKCDRDSLLLHVFPKSKRQHKTVAGRIEVEFIQKGTVGIQKLPKWRSTKDVTFETDCKIKNVNEMKKFLGAVWETKNIMNCWKASTYMVYGFQMLGKCSTGGSLDDSLECVKESLRKPNKIVRESKQNKSAPKKARSWWRFWTWW